MKKFCLISLFALALFVQASAQQRYVSRNDYHIGADLSFLKQAEDSGTRFRENGEVKPGMQIFTDHGYNWIRLRLFHTPTAWEGEGGVLPNDLQYTIEMAKEAKARGMKFLLNYHYSDTWADPAKQYIPKAWEGYTHEQLVQAVFDYTLETMNELREAGVYPDMVQVGNEITNGMLWPDGRLPANWNNFIDLLRAGINGVYASCTADLPTPRIMIHIEKGGDRNATKNFFDRIELAGLPYDVIGQSYYPWWHGSLLDLRENMHFMATAYRKDIILVEVAYNMEPREYRDKPAPYPETPEGQREFMESVHEIVMGAPDNRGLGVYWWEPATGRGGNRTYFDREGNVQPVITVFDKYTRK